MRAIHCERKEHILCARWRVLVGLEGVVAQHAKDKANGCEYYRFAQTDFSDELFRADLLGVKQRHHQE